MALRLAAILPHTVHKKQQWEITAQLHYNTSSKIDQKRCCLLTCQQLLLVSWHAMTVVSMQTDRTLMHTATRPAGLQDVTHLMHEPLQRYAHEVARGQSRVLAASLGRLVLPGRVQNYAVVAFTCRVCSQSLGDAYMQLPITACPTGQPVVL